MTFRNSLLTFKKNEMKKFTFLKIACFVFIISIQGVYAQIPSNGLVGYFPLNGNANDQNGNGITGTVTTGGFPANTPPVLTADRNSVANSAYNFVPNINSTSYINLGQPSQFNFGTGAFSISLWMKFTVYLVSPTMVANNAWNFRLRDLGGSNHLNFMYGAGSFNSDAIISPNTWVHVAGVYNQASNTMELYINGAPATGFSYSGGPIGPTGQPSLNTATLTLNGTPSNATQLGLNDIVISTGFKGALDDVLFYNRALSASEVSAIYTATGLSGVEEIANEKQFRVFPTLSNGLVTVQVPGTIANGTALKVYNLEGKLVMEQKNISKTQQLDLGELGNGYYLLKLETPSGFYTQKVNVIK